MRKIMVLLSMIVLFSNAVFAMVDSTSTPIWKIGVDTPNQAFIKADLLTRSIAFNKATDHLLVATRLGGARIVVLNAATGDSVGLMDTATLAGGTYVLNKVAVAGDGAIYGCNLNTGNGFKIYRWADESAAPTVALDSAVTGAVRYGDALNVLGSGLDTKIFISGNNDGAKIAILGTNDGHKFFVEKIVPKNSRAMDIYPVDMDSYWTNYPGANARLVNSSGDIVGQVPLTEIPSSSSALVHFGYAGHWYLGNADGNIVPASGRLVQLGDTPADATLRAVFKGVGANANTSGAGGVAVDPETDRIWILTTNNSIALYPFGGFAAFPLAWRAKAAATPWIGTADGARALAYSPVSKHLYLASTVGGNFIKVIDPATGQVTGELNTAGIGGDPYPLNRLTATADGQIFAANLAQANGAFKIYRYANETAAPMLIYAGIVPARVGDALACSGRGGAITLYASGAGNDKILTFVSGENSAAARSADIPLPEADAASMGISPVGSGDYLFISAPGKAVRYIKRNGTVLNTFAASEASGATVAYIEVPTHAGIEHKYLMLPQGTKPGVRVIELLGEDGDNLCAYWEDTQMPALSPAYSANPNPEATSQVVYEVHNNQIIELCGNNGLSAYSFANVMPEAGVLEPVPVFSQDYLDFGRLYVGQTVARSFAITNTGTSPFEITGSGFDGDEFSSDLVLPAKVAAGETLHVAMTLNVTQPGEISDVFTLFSNAGIYEVALKAQASELWPLVWRQAADTTLWHGSSSMVRTLAYNKATKHLIAISRAGGNLIKVLDPKTGKVVKELINTGIDGGTYHIDMMAVTGDGQLFAGNLALEGQNFQLYRWANELAAPVKVFDGPLANRVGDALGVIGAGNQVTVYASGSDNEKIFTILTTDGVLFSRGEDIALPAMGAATNSISPAAPGYLFIAGPDQEVRYLKTDGTVLHTFDLTVVQGALCSYFEAVSDADVTRRFLAVSDGFAPGTRVIELAGDPGDALCSAFTILPVPTPAYSAIMNPGGNGQVVYNRVLNQLVELATNNGISAYSFATVLPNPKKYIVITAIADVKKDLDNDFKPDLVGQEVTLIGIINSPNFNAGASSSFYLQDEEGWGINLYSSNTNYPLEIGDKVMITGIIDNYYGLAEIAASGLTNIEILEKGVALLPQDLTGAGLTERTEGTLARINGYYLENPAAWPAVGKNATLKFVRGVDTVLVFIDKETDIDGSAVPQGYWSLTGVVDQYTKSVPPNNGYEIRPRSLADMTQMTGVARENRDLPSAYALRQNYPNPFNPVTTIAFDAPQEGEVRIKVYDLLGKAVATVFEGKLSAGFHTFEFNASALSSGVYFYRVESAKFVEMKKMTLLK